MCLMKRNKHSRVLARHREMVLDAKLKSVTVSFYVNKNPVMQVN